MSRPSVIEAAPHAIGVPSQTEILAASVRNMLSAIGEDPAREGLSARRSGWRRPSPISPRG